MTITMDDLGAIGDFVSGVGVLVRQGRGEPLEPAERLQVSFVLRGQLIAFENYFNQFRLGLMDRTGWESRREIVVTILGNTAARALWETSLVREHHPAFVREVSDALARSEKLRGSTSAAAT